MPDGRPRDPDELRGFESFYREAYGILVSAAFMTTRDTAAAEDAAQDAFVEIALDWPSWTCKPWEQKVAHARIAAVRNSIDHYRRDRRSRKIQHLGGRWAGGFTHVESDVMARDLVRLVLAIQGKRQRAIAVLAFLQDLSAKEIAHELGIEASTVRTVMLRLRKRLRSAHVEVDENPRAEQIDGRDSNGTA